MWWNWDETVELPKIECTEWISMLHSILTTYLFKQTIVLCSAFMPCAIYERMADRRMLHSMWIPSNYIKARRSMRDCHLKIGNRSNRPWWINRISQSWRYFAHTYRPRSQLICIDWNACCPWAQMAISLCDTWNANDVAELIIRRFVCSYVRW